MSETEAVQTDIEKDAEEQAQITVEPGWVPVYDANGTVTDKVKLPPIFFTPIRGDVIKKAVLAVQSSRIQPQGRNPLAGKRTTAVSRGVGLGIARVPRVKGAGYSRAGQAAMAPSTVSGRLAHPPKVTKKIIKLINKKEQRLALQSAVAATANFEYVQFRGHRLPEGRPIPFVVEDELQELKNTKSVVGILKTLGLGEELKRITDGIKVRPGRGKMRGRRYKERKGPLIIVEKNKGITRATSNLPGVEVTLVDRLNPEILAPGTHPGRLTIWSKSALKRLEQLKAAG